MSVSAKQSSQRMAILSTRFFSLGTRLMFNEPTN
jgi:hypothetical protein